LHGQTIVVCGIGYPPLDNRYAAGVEVKCLIARTSEGTRCIIPQVGIATVRGGILGSGGSPVIHAIVGSEIGTVGTICARCLRSLDPRAF
jgi:hypothetical protein